VVHHRRGLRRLLRNDELVAAVEHDWTTAGLSPKRTAMLEYAVKLIETPAATTDAPREADHLPGPRQMLASSSCRFLP